MVPTGTMRVGVAEVTEARRNSAPGRARHRPSDHRAGKAWYRLPCYAPVHSVCIPFSTGVLMGASRRPVFPAPFPFGEGEENGTTRAKPAARTQTRAVVSMLFCRTTFRAA